MAKRRYYACFASFLVTFPLSICLFLWLASVTSAAGTVTLDGSLDPSKKGPVGAGTVNGAPTTYLISEDLGKRAGDNLFHSFDTFNIGTGESATFTGYSGISNIISRVTGGSPSSIDGLIRSTIDGANLFLLNPSGVMFGPNASLDISGSFHVSTADYLKFSDGNVFYANPAANSVLSTAAPEAFGFLSSPPAGISGDKAFLQVPEGKTISIIGGDITYQAYPVSTDASSPDFVFNVPGVLTAPGGRINLVSLASPGEVNLATLDTGTAKLGKITFSDGAKLSVLDFDGNGNMLPAGNIVIRGGQIIFRDGGIDAYGDPGGVIDVKGGSLNLDSYYFYPATYANTSHPGTACRIDITGDFLMTHSSLIDSSNFASGRGGDIRITAGDVKIGDDILDARSYTGPSLGYYGYISATTSGSGRGGDIYISSAGNLTIQNGFFVNTTTLADGDAGNITTHAAVAIQFRDKGNIATDAFGLGGGGTIDVTARDILISAANEKSVENIDTITGIAAHTGASSNGRRIELSAENVQILDGGTISTVLFGEGRGADVEINAKNITVSGYVAYSSGSAPYYLSSIDGRVYGSAATGTGGNITIITENMKISNGGAIRTGLFDDANGGPSGNAGNINIKAGDIEIKDRGQIYADSYRGTGNSGEISISANNLRIAGAAGTPRPEPLDFDFTGLSTTTNSGHGGTIDVSLTGDLTLTAQGAISADTQGTGAGGAVNIAAQNILLTYQSKISSSSIGTGNAGNIDIAVTTDSLKMRDSSITTEAMQADGGNIRITAPYMVYLTDSKITASVGGGPQTAGGNISIDPQYIILKNSRIIANAYEGKGGNIQIVADTFLADPKSAVDASSALGISGTVNINAPINNVSGILNPLSTDFISATALLRERCIARLRGGKYSSFIVGGRDGLPIEPGNLLPSLLY